MKNYVNNYINTAKKRCSGEADQKEAEQKIKIRLKKNGFTDKDLNRLYNTRKRSRRPKYSNNNCTLMIPFVSDSLNRKIRNLISKFNLDIQLINRGNRKLKDSFLPKKSIQ